MKAVLILGNPKYINNDIAQNYYKEIMTFLKANQVEVILDEGKDMTCPPKADFYIGHSRGAGRIRCFERTPQHKDFLRFGDIGGYIHPVDEEWQKANPPDPMVFRRPPPEHFMFTKEQKNAILDKINELRNPPGSAVQATRQSPSLGRPKPRG